jgi:hypothetical protein
VCHAAIEYFLMVNTVPVASRHPQMGAPLYGALAQPLLAHCCYPEGFEGWAECVEEDEEAFGRCAHRRRWAVGPLPAQPPGMWGPCLLTLPAEPADALSSWLLCLPPPVAPLSPQTHDRFREQSVAELLEVVYNMVGPPFLSGLRDSLHAASSWREAEAALFALRAVGGPARRAALSAAAPNGGAVRELLGALLGELCAPSGRLVGGMLAASPIAHASAAELVGAYAPWFEAAEGAPLEGALVLLLAGLSAPPPAPPPAAAALRALCSRCSSRLGGAPGAAAALAGLAERAAAVVAPAPPDGAPAGPAALAFDERLAVAEALSRVAASLPPPDAPPAAARLAAPHIARAQSILAHGGAAAAAGGAAAQQLLLDTLSEEIKLVAALVRRLELPPGQFAGTPGAPPGAPQHPALAVLEACWPLLGAVAESPLCRQEAGVVDAVCDVFNVRARGRRGTALCCHRKQAAGCAPLNGPATVAAAPSSQPPLPPHPLPPPYRSACSRGRGRRPSRCCRRCCAPSLISSWLTTSPRAC